MQNKTKLVNSQTETPDSTTEAQRIQVSKRWDAVK